MEGIMEPSYHRSKPGCPGVVGRVCTGLRSESDNSYFVPKVATISMYHVAEFGGFSDLNAPYNTLRGQIVIVEAGMGVKEHGRCVASDVYQ
jgi:hypothetical protein